MSSVRSLTVTGYKSIRELKAFPLNDLNVLIGANGAGKSNFIGLFRLLGEIVEERLQLYVQTQGGPDALLHGGRARTERLHAEFFFAQNGYKFDRCPLQITDWYLKMKRAGSVAKFIQVPTAPRSAPVTKSPS